MNLIIFGPPGAGKGTQAERIAGHFGLSHISTGDIFRENINTRTKLGIKSQEYIKYGKLVPDEIVNLMMTEKLASLNNGFILDGYPRTLQQAEFLENSSKRIDWVISLDVKEEAVIERLSLRFTCGNCQAAFHKIYNPPENEGVCDKCGGNLYLREDDTEDVVKKRLDVYMTETLPVMNFYEDKGSLIKVDGNLSIDKVAMLIFDILKQKEEAKK